MEHNETKIPETGNNSMAKKPSSLKWKAVNLLIAGVFIAGVFMLVRQYYLPENTHMEIPTQKPVQITPTPIITPQLMDPPAVTETQPGQALPKPTPDKIKIEVPVKVYFEKQKQEAPIIPVGIGEGNVIGSPDSAVDSGWFHLSAPPGDPGTSVLNGHQMFGGKKGVFSVLKNMKVGEEVIVEFESGLLRYFVVDRIETFLTEDVPEEYRTVGRDTETQLILFTCKGDYGLDGFSKSRVVAICHENMEKRRADDIFVDYREQYAETEA